MPAVRSASGPIKVPSCEAPISMGTPSRAIGWLTLRSDMRAEPPENPYNHQTLMVRRREAPSRTMRPHWCHSSFETPLRGSSG